MLCSIYLKNYQEPKNCCLDILQRGWIRQQVPLFQFRRRWQRMCSHLWKRKATHSLNTPFLYFHAERWGKPREVIPAGTAASPATYSPSLWYPAGCWSDECCSLQPGPPAAEWPIFGPDGLYPLGCEPAGRSPPGLSALPARGQTFLSCQMFSQPVREIISNKRSQLFWYQACSSTVSFLDLLFHPIGISVCHPSRSLWLLFNFLVLWFLSLL